MVRAPRREAGFSCNLKSRRHAGFFIVLRNLPIRPTFIWQGNTLEAQMLYYALVFLVIALIAGVLGFGGIAGASAGIAQILFFLFLAFLVISLVIGLFRRT
jgi:uncharacterized membrane protein YtjA (UPF0391 family)